MKTREYKITAVDMSGNTVDIQMAASSLDEIYDHLSKRGLEPVSIKRTFDINLFGSSSRLSDYEMIFFFRQILSMVLSGVSVGEGIKILASKIEDIRFRGIFRELATSISQGKSFADSLKDSNYFFPPVIISFINQGENSGDMVEVFKRTISYWEKKRNIKNRLIDALIYPALLLVIIFFIVIFLTMIVIPEFTKIYADFSESLPLITQMTLNFSDFIRAHYLIIFGSFIGILFAFFLSLKGKMPLLFSLIIRMPIIKTFYRYYTISYTSMALSALLGSGMEIDDSLEILQNGTLESRVIEARKLLRSGNRLSVSLSRLQIFSAVNIEMIAVGEDSGRLVEIFQNMSEFYDGELEIYTKRALTLLEPLLIITLGGMVGFIVFSMFLPIIQLSSLIK